MFTLAKGNATVAVRGKTKWHVFPRTATHLGVLPSIASLHRECRNFDFRMNIVVIVRTSVIRSVTTNNDSVESRRPVEGRISTSHSNQIAWIEKVDRDENLQVPIKPVQKSKE